LASFYLGQEHELATGQTLERPVHYDARNLTTHAVCLGMTGSGKSGLGVVLLEEATLDGVPSLVIDPKGDMTNLLLTFPDLDPQDFLPWVNPDDAHRKELSLDAYAAQVADQWRDGLAASGQGPDRIRRLKEAADFTIFTPGSSAGRQLSILHTLRVPALSWEEDSELFRDKIEGVVSALLGLIGVDADPVRSREHILLSNVFENAWRKGEDLDLAQLILRIQKPPFTQLGVFPVDTFFPEKDRLELAMLLNGLMASPSFADWIQGQPLDIDGLLHSSSGKPQVSIFYIAHLSDSEKQFFVTLLLEQVLSWMHTQSGTTSLRALLYMDEMFGYLPPYPANPPSKKPLLTLLKQARAFGLGLILATQNPADLDYKALSNAGTWFVGRMQADRDKQRLLDGLEGVQTTQERPSRGELDRIISALGSRVFLLHSVHEDKPVVFRTRWAMSYLRGPLTRPQVQDLMEAQPLPLEPVQGAPETGAQAALPSKPLSAAPAPEPVSPHALTPPQLPSSVKQLFLPVQVPLRDALAHSALSAVQQEGHLVYEPALLGLAELRFAHTKSRQTQTEEVAYLLRLEGEELVVDWAAAKVRLGIEGLESSPEPGAFFAALPSELGEARRHTGLRDEFSDFLYYNSSLSLWYNPHVDIYSEPGEGAKSFQRRCRKAVEKAHEAEAEKLRDKYEQELARLEDRQRREERELVADKIDYDARKQEELLSGIESVFGLFSRRRSSRSLSTASRKHRLTRQAKADIKESEQVIGELEEQIKELEHEARRELEELAEKWAELIDEVEEIEVRPRRADVRINLFALAWVPHWEVRAGLQLLSLPAFEAEAA
jgi:hypothetical protein